MSGLSARLWLVVGLLFTASFLNYVDRQTLSVLKPTIKAEFGLDDSGYAVLVNIFTFCYAAAYMGSGWVVDRLGARLALTLFIVGWSLATIACGLAQSFFAFATFRALLGIMEPGNFPATIRAMTFIAPLSDRAFLMSLTGAGSTVGAIAAAPLIAALATGYSWQAAFIVPGVAGLGLAAIWWWVYREQSESGGTGEASPPPPAPPMPWRKLWGQSALWGVVLARLVSDPVWYYCLFWMPGYFQEQRGLSLQATGNVAWIPFLVGNVGALLCASYSDRLTRRGVPGVSSRMRVLLGAALCAPLVAFVPHSAGLAGTVALLGLMVFVCLSWLLLLMPMIADIFPAGNVGSVWAIAGAFGAVGGIVFNFLIGRVSSTVGSESIFLALGFLHLVAFAILFLLTPKRFRAHAG